MPAADFLFQLLHFAREEFDGSSAFGTDHVVMAAAVVLVFVAGDAVVEGDFAGQSALGEQFQSPVDRSVANDGVFFLHQPMQFVGGEMIASFEEGTQDGIPLRGLLEADFLEVPVEDLLGLPDHLARNGRLIVDAILERASLLHEGSG